MGQFYRKALVFLTGRVTVNTLYRYTPHNNEERRDELITKAQLWFTKPENFNDPLDSKLYYRQEYTQEEIKLFWDYFLKNNPGYAQSLPEVLERIGSNEAFILQQNKLFKEYRSHISVCCFSASPKEILMWSHYAKDHEGIVYEFTIDLFSSSTSNSFKGRPFKVDYAKDNSDNYELLSYALTDKLKEGQCIKELLTKANEWKYEEEYRFIDINGSGNKSFKKESLKSIIFGVKTQKDEIIRIKNLCQEHGFQNVVFKQTKFLPGEFKITLVDI
jgi:hypothetical protein